MENALKATQPGHTFPSSLSELSVLTTLVVESACGSPAAQPVTVGIPLPRGAVTDPGRVVLLDPQDHETPLQRRPLARWSDGSVKWLLLDFLADEVPPGGARWKLGQEAVVKGRPPAGSMRIRESARSVVVETGAATFHLDRTTLRPLARVLLGGEDVLEPGSGRTVLVDPKGSRGTPSVERVAVEARGPVRATVRFEGTFTGSTRCRFVVRLCFFAGTGLVRIRLTVHNPNRARHPGGLWDLGDAGSLFFRDLSLELALKGPSRLAWTAEAAQPLRATNANRLEIYQDSSGGGNWQSRNHVNRYSRVPCSFRGYRVRSGSREEFGRRASPLVSLQGPGGQVTAAVPEFWQQFPKAVEADGPLLRVRLFPQQFSSLFELQGGEQKTPNCLDALRAARGGGGVHHSLGSTSLPALVLRRSGMRLPVPCRTSHPPPRIRVTDWRRFSTRSCWGRTTCSPAASHRRVRLAQFRRGLCRPRGRLLQGSGADHLALQQPV